MGKKPGSQAQGTGAREGVRTAGRNTAALPAGRDSRQELEARQTALEAENERLRQLNARLQGDAEAASQGRDIHRYLDALPVLIVALDLEGRIVEVNPFALNLLGYSENELLGRNWFETCLPQPDGMETEYPAFRRLMAGHASQPREREGTVVCRDGTSRLIAWHEKVLTGEDGRITGRLSSGMDITTRRRTELALQDSEARYRRFAEELPLGIIITQDGVIKYVNQALLNFLGYAEEDLLEKPFLPFVCEADREWLIDLHRRRMEGEKVQSSYVIGVVHKGGAIRQWQLYTSTIEWNGKLSALGSIADVTERGLYEQQLRIAATTFESQEGIVITDANNVILRVNRSFINITGYSAEEVIGKSTRMFKSGQHDSDFYATMWQRITSRGSWEGDIWNRRKSGEIFPAHLIITAVKDEEGILTNYVATYSDITARVNAEEKLRDSLRKLEEKERAKTRFLAAAGHDLRQPIAAATLFLEALKFTSQTKHQSTLIERVDHSMRIFSSLLDRLLDISKFDAGLIVPQVTVFSLADLFTWLEQTFDQPVINKHLRLRLYFPVNSKLSVSTDIALVQSVLMNLVTNAIKFTARGSILVAARLRGNNVLFQVWDTGVGIAAEDLPYIFDEFYQVANPQRNREAGLGLGLSICQRTMSLLGGTITCRSRAGRGSVFEFSLPLDGQPAEARPLPSSHTTKNVAGETLLRGKRVVVVEDDSLVAAGLVTLLHSLGAEVRHFQNAESALSQADTGTADYFMVDYALGGGLNGIQFLEAVERLGSAPVRAVILTGETSSEFIGSVSKNRWPVLHKPADYATLISSLNQ